MPLLGGSAMAAPAAAAAADVSSWLPSNASILATMRAVNDAWIAGHPDPGGVGWARATYFSGNLALHRLTQDPGYRSYAEGWAERADYRLGGPTPTRHADDQAAGQVFNDLYALDPDPAKVASIDGALEAMVYGPSPAVDDWWWVDALHMSMPNFVSAAQRHGDPAYLAKLHALYADTRNRRGLWNPTSRLWYRDVAAIGSRSPSGRRVLWSRGNGWAIAGHAKTLALLPPGDDRWPAYGGTLVAMAKALNTAQRSDGFWNMNLADPTHAPGPESSGTAFFAYGLAHGLRTGRLAPFRFRPTLARAWNGMVAKAVRADGSLGYVQGVASSPSSQPPSGTATADYAVGALLLAGCEIIRMTSAPRRSPF